MAKRKRNQAPPTPKGEQGLLMEIAPKGLEKIRPFVLKCKKAQAARKRHWDVVIDCKENIKEIVHQLKVKPNPNGKIIFKCEGVTVEIEKGDEKVTLKDIKEES